MIKIIKKIISLMTFSFVLIINTFIGVDNVYSNSSFPKFELEKLIDNGKDGNKLVLMVMAEGYKDYELDKFERDANVMIQGFLEEDVFSEYKRDINVYLLKTISNDSGVSTNKNQLKDTYFGATMNYAFNIERLIGVVHLDRLKEQRDATGIDYDIGIILVNTDLSGGSGGENIVLTANSYSSKVLAHEMGHTFAGLGDEYYASAELLAERPNTTRNSGFDDIKWKSYIGENGIDIYPLEGSNGWYVPSQNCKMKFLEQKFCDVCKAEIEKNLVNEVEKTEISNKSNRINNRKDIKILKNEYNQITVTINNSIVKFDEQPTIIEGRTLVPVRAIFENLGLDVTWEPMTQTISGKNDEIIISMYVGQKYAYVNGKYVKLEVPSKVIRGRTFVPLRFIAESTGAKVTWEN